ncbi:FxLD family lanthipeptide [Allokutzneria sp. NRRL B-24872]|uniref:FxLD family lanthipeptide n=1 Tax=Allokutzneria sp. NRRL B-24872 TaxID=1137961 RepID=UPI000A3D60C7|nr:FxLD family lanthipeptide [Allokutzneria sp. NRRL B-24872]
MSPMLTLGHTEAADSAVDEADFVLDMRVVESTTKLVIMMCDTSDGCGSTCSTSACSSGSNDPF